MSIITQEQVNVTRRDRTYHTHFSTEYGEPYGLVAFRETRRYDDNGNFLGTIKHKNNPIRRKLLNADGTPAAFTLPDGTEEYPVTNTVTLDSGKVISLADILEAGSKFGDALETQDKEIAAARAAAAEENQGE